MLAILWAALAQRFEIIASATPVLEPPPSVPVTRLVADWQAAVSPPAVQVTQLPATYLATEPLEFSWVRETQRDIGTAVHAWLARLAGAPQLPEGAAVLAQLVRLGVPPSEQPRALEVILTALRRTLADERGRWILSGTHREAFSEWELSGVSRGRLRNVKIDRSFIDESGTRWVIDYKTSAHEGGDLEEFLAQEIERYRPQLEAYVELARALGPQRVRAALYFPLLGAFREVI
jgi:ATP-dependent exoDNAse (exonuclease V) beta subunit